jgi:acyl-CoA reductase-like NAD-dependent aldehyde dehydrogenase
VGETILSTSGLHRKIKRLTLELGGKNAAIVTRHADLGTHVPVTRFHRFARALLDLLESRPLA